MGNVKLLEKELFLNDTITLYHGDCIEIMKQLPDNFIDSVCTDPPYHLTSFKNKNSKGFMDKEWDGGDIAFRTELWSEVFRVLKPGGYICAFSGSRTYHRMACAIEDAGFITHPMLIWLFSNGFPKSYNLSRQIDKELGYTREKIIKFTSKTRNPAIIGGGRDEDVRYTRPFIQKSIKEGVYETESDKCISEKAKEWDGWEYGLQSLKPAMEPIYFGQKLFSEKTGALNVLKWGVGAININDCRIGLNGGTRKKCKTTSVGNYLDEKQGKPINKWRWPANVVHDGSAEVLSQFKNIERFYYTAKATVEDRAGSKHPTIKPISLMRWLIRLITPPNGVVLDCFAGTGTTGTASHKEGVKAILIEKENEYIEDIKNRFNNINQKFNQRLNSSIMDNSKIEEFFR